MNSGELNGFAHEPPFAILKEFYLMILSKLSDCTCTPRRSLGVR